MKWFQENKFLAVYLIVLVVCTAVAVWFVLGKKAELEEANARFETTSTELNRLLKLAPFPSEENYRKMKALADDYANSVNALAADLNARVLPVQPMAPNEFQARLRQAVTDFDNKARENRVKIPENFYLGFDDFASSLPNTAAAPLLGQQLQAVQLLLNLLLDAHVESLVEFRRTPLPEERAAPPPPSAAKGGKPGNAAHVDAGKVVDRNTMTLTFLSSPAVQRKVLNQIANLKEQIFVVRLLRVQNEKDKGPPRVLPGAENGAAAPAGGPAPAPPVAPVPGAAGAKPADAGGLTFIVGTERLETSATVERLKFSLPGR